MHEHAHQVVSRLRPAVGDDLGGVGPVLAEGDARGLHLLGGGVGVLALHHVVGPAQQVRQLLVLDPADQPDNTAFQNRVSKHLQTAVDRLPKRQREVLLLHVNEGLTYKEIADRLNVTYRIVLRDLTRAYASLRMQLKAEDL